MSIARADIHSPSNFNPGAYTYVGSFDNWPAPGSFMSPTLSAFQTVFGPVDALNPANANYRAAHILLAREGAKIHFNSDKGSSQCDHCGARIRYVSVYRHTSGECVAVGSDCAEVRFGCDNRRELDIKQLREEAASERERQRVFPAATLFIQDVAPELEEWLLTPAAETVGGIFLDLARRLTRYGKLSIGQMTLARKLLQEHYERVRSGGKSDREIRYARERAQAEDCPQGRVQITGKVLKSDLAPTKFGMTRKITIKDDRGFIVWMTCPECIATAERGARVELFAQVAPSKKDPKFGVGKRPTKARLLAAA